MYIQGFQDEIEYFKLKMVILIDAQILCKERQNLCTSKFLCVHLQPNIREHWKEGKWICQLKFSDFSVIFVRQKGLADKLLNVNVFSLNKIYLRTFAYLNLMILVLHKWLIHKVVNTGPCAFSLNKTYYGNYRIKYLNYKCLSNILNLLK